MVSSLVDSGSSTLVSLGFCDLDFGCTAGGTLAGLGSDSTGGFGSDSTGVVD